MPEQEFALIGSQGAFPVPAGESRIGSDAACQICIRGEGVLPVHAYLRMDGGRLLIRPAGSASGDKQDSGIVLVNGKPLAGPANVSSGQEVAFGGIRMRVQASGARPPSLWSRRWFRSSVYTLAGITLALLLGYLYIAYVVLDEQGLKARVQRSVARYLLRDDTEITSVQVRLFQGAIDLTNVVVKDRYDFSSSARPFIRIPSVHIELDMWPLLASGMRDFSNLHIDIEQPEVNIERSKTDGAFSIQDIIDKYQRPVGRPDIDRLDFHLAIHGGSVHLRDDYTNIGETSLENIEIALHSHGANDPVAIDQCSMTMASSARVPQEGRLSVGGSVQLFDQAYGIDSSRITSDDLHVELKDFDLARVFEHFGYAWKPYRANFKIVLGKPLSGDIHLKLRGFQEILTNGSVSSASLLSLREEKKAPLGNIPMTLAWDARLIDGGKGYTPHDLSVDLKGGPRDDPYIAFRALGKLNPSGISNYTMDFECRLQDLLSTDIGSRMGLKGTMGGRLKGTGTLLREASGALKIDARMESIDGYVNVADPAELSKPPEKRKPPVRQMLPLKFDCHANAEPNQDGAISYVNIDSFSLSAPSFSANSKQGSGIIKGLGPSEKLDAHAQFTLKLKGREFWAEFAPILALFGFTRPIEEVFDLKVTLVTDSQREGVVSLAAEGTSARQWGPDSAPVQLLALLEYDIDAGKRSGEKAPPYLTLGLRVTSDNELPLEVRLRAVCSRSDKAETVVIEGFDPDRNSMLVNSDIQTLRARFAPYIESWLRAHDEAYGLGDKGWASFYRGMKLSGALEQSGRVVIRRMLDPNSPEPDRVSFDLNVAGKDFGLDIPLKGAQSRAGQPDGRFIWKEPNPKLRIKGEYTQRLSSNKEEPHHERIDIENLQVDGRLGGFQIAVRDLDLFKLANLPALPNQAWTDVLGALSVSGKINPPASDFLRGIGVLAPNSPLYGSVALKAAFDREKDALALSQFVYRQDEQRRDLPLAVLDVNGSLLRLRDLCNRLFPVKGGAPFSERLAAFIDDGGPAAMLDHLGDDLSLNQMQVETGPLLEWLKREEKFGPEDRVVPPLIASLRRGDWRPEGTWKVAGLKLSRVGDPKKRSWKLVGAMLRNDLSIFGRAPAPGAERPVVFHFTHDWKVQLGLSLSEDNSVGLVGDIHLDDAFISASMPWLKYEYHKPAKEPCRIEISEFAYAHGLLAQAGRLRLIGKPLSLDLRDFKADFTGPAKGAYSIGEMLVDGGPLPCAIILNKYEPAADGIDIRISAPELNLPWLADVAGLPPLLSGGIKDVDASYKGSLVALRAMAERDTSRLAELLKLKAGDPRLQGLNPESDALEFSGKLDGVALTLPLDEQQTLQAKLGGRMKLTTRDLAFRDFSADLVRNGSQSAERIAFTAPRLNVNTLDPRLNLFQAAHSPGVPLDIHGSVVLSTPLRAADFAANLHRVLGLAHASAATDAPGERRFSVFDKLALSGSIGIPALKIGRFELSNVEVQNFSVKGLKLAFAAISADICGGHGILSDGEWDLGKGRTVIENGKPAIKGIDHEEKLALIDADLGQLLGASGASGYAIGGRVTAQHGTLKGSDFFGGDRLSWNGAVKFRIAGLTIAAPQRQTGGAAAELPPWSVPVAGAYGEAYANAFRAAIGSETAASRELWTDGAAGAAQPTQAFLLALQAYLARVAAFENDKLEFEAIEPTVEIDKGSARTATPVQLIGRGSCEGLELTARNVRVSLATEAFNDDAGEGLLLYPSAIPRGARARLRLEKWPAEAQAEYLRSLNSGALPLRVYGQLSAPVFKFPWAEVRVYASRALFDMEKIADTAALASARANFSKLWGADKAAIEQAAAVADRLGLGLPGTQAARDCGESCIERVTGLPQSLYKLLSKTVPPISPASSLRQLLNPDPDPVPPGAKPKSGEKNKAARTKKAEGDAP